jgi:carbonic anhydrase
MDGRIQIPVIKYLQEKFDAEYVDSVTEPGPNLILANRNDKNLVKSILNRVAISVEKHNSVGIAVVGHHDCAGNPSEYESQLDQIKKSIKFISSIYEGLEVIGLWVNSDWTVEEVD